MIRHPLSTIIDRAGPAALFERQDVDQVDGSKLVTVALRSPRLAGIIPADVLDGSSSFDAWSTLTAPAAAGTVLTLASLLHQVASSLEAAALDERQDADEKLEVSAGEARAPGPLVWIEGRDGAWHLVADGLPPVCAVELLSGPVMLPPEHAPLCADCRAVATLWAEIRARRAAAGDDTAPG